MSRINQCFRRKLKQFHDDALKKHLGITLLKIGPPATADEQSVTAEKHTVHEETHAALGMSWSRQSLNDKGSKSQFLPNNQKKFGFIWARIPTYCHFLPSCFNQLPLSCLVIRMKVGFKNITQGQSKFPDQVQVAFVLLQNRVDAHRFQRKRIKDQIAIGPASWSNNWRTIGF